MEITKCQKCGANVMADFLSDHIRYVHEQDGIRKKPEKGQSRLNPKMDCKLNSPVVSGMEKPKKSGRKNPKILLAKEERTLKANSTYHRIEILFCVLCGQRIPKGELLRETLNKPTRSAAARLN